MLLNPVLVPTGKLNPIVNKLFIKTLCVDAVSKNDAPVQDGGVYRNISLSKLEFFTSVNIFIIEVQLPTPKKSLLVNIALCICTTPPSIKFLEQLSPGAPAPYTEPLITFS